MDELKAWLAQDLDLVVDAITSQCERVGLAPTDEHCQKVWADFLRFELQAALAHSANNIKGLILPHALPARSD